MKKSLICALSAMLFCGLIGCSENGKSYDAVAIAGEADAGNLKPLEELRSACHKEVADAAVKKKACAALEKAGSLRKKVF